MKLLFTRRAARQLTEILDYIAERSPQGARRVHDRIEVALRVLLDHPAAGVLTDEPDTRRIVVNPHPYSIFYQVRGDEVIVERIRHTARQPGA